MELLLSPLYNDARLISYWRMEGNSNDTKGVSNGQDTNIAYNASYGKYGQGALLNGSSSKIVIPGNGAYNFDDKISLSIHAKLNSTTGTHPLIFKGSNPFTFYIWYPNAPTMEWNVPTGGAVLNYAPTFDTNYHHLGFTYDKDGGTNNRKIFYDGIEVAHDTTTGALDTTNRDITIGNYSTYWFDGCVDDMALFHGILTADEMLSLATESGSPRIINFI